MPTRLGVCNLCEAICGLEIRTEGDAIVSIRGYPAAKIERPRLLV